MSSLSSLVKFSGPDLNDETEFTHPNVWQREDHPDGSRLVIGAREREISLILDLSRGMRGPFAVLYVLVLSRLGHGEGRYQSPAPIDYDVMERFLVTFQDFFEQDGRHHLWVMSWREEGQFIFDRHNLIYAYGDLDRYESHLKSAGFARGRVAIPAPHAHYYHPEFNTAENELMAYWSWMEFPLHPEHDR